MDMPYKNAYKKTCALAASLQTIAFKQFNKIPRTYYKIGNTEQTNERQQPMMQKLIHAQCKTKTSECTQLK